MNTTIKLKVSKEFERKCLWGKIGNKLVYIHLKYKPGEIINTDYKGIKNYQTFVNQGYLEIVNQSTNKV
jgi:hypothetical protein